MDFLLFYAIITPAGRCRRRRHLRLLSRGGSGGGFRRRSHLLPHDGSTLRHGVEGRAVGLQGNPVCRRLGCAFTSCFYRRRRRSSFAGFTFDYHLALLVLLGLFPLGRHLFDGVLASLLGSGRPGEERDDHEEGDGERFHAPNVGGIVKGVERKGDDSPPGSRRHVYPR